jgi:ABC-type multidrug transport system fused ATPase/permease subunit
MVVIAFTFLFPQLMSTITIAVFIYVGNSMDLSSAYTIKIIFNYVKDPLKILPHFFAQMAETRIALNRIQKFLVCDEINTGVTNIEELKRDGPKSANLPDDVAFEFRL